MDLAILSRIAWTSTYTYILLFFVAAAFVAFIGRPRRRGEAVQHLYAGTLLPDFPEGLQNIGTPQIHVKCLEGGKVLIERLNVEGLTSSGAVSLAVTFTGKDIEVKERVSYGYPDDPVLAGASFLIDMTGYEWRHIHWINEESGLWAAFSLHVREGIRFSVELKR